MIFLAGELPNIWSYTVYIRFWPILQIRHSPWNARSLYWLHAQPCVPLCQAARCGIHIWQQRVVLWDVGHAAHELDAWWVCVAFHSAVGDVVGGWLPLMSRASGRARHLGRARRVGRLVGGCIWWVGQASLVVCRLYHGRVSVIKNCSMACCAALWFMGIKLQLQIRRWFDSRLMQDLCKTYAAHLVWKPAGWFECFPDPPMGILSRLDALLGFHDIDLVRASADESVV